MRVAADLISALAQFAWPLVFVGLIVLLRREIRALLHPGVEFALEFGGGRISIKPHPTKPPSESSALPAISEGERLPPDYVFVNHTCFLRQDKQEEFQRRTGVPLPHYDIRVIVDSYYEGALDRVERVEYFLHEAYPEPIQVRTRKEDKFLLKELANGEYVLLAQVYLRGQRQPLLLQRYITLWHPEYRVDGRRTGSA